jgi:hypothetical protein
MAAPDADDARASGAPTSSPPRSAEFTELSDGCAGMLSCGLIDFRLHCTSLHGSAMTQETHVHVLRLGRVGLHDRI